MKLPRKTRWKPRLYGTCSGTSDSAREAPNCHDVISISMHTAENAHSHCAWSVWNHRPEARPQQKPAAFVAHIETWSRPPGLGKGGPHTIHNDRRYHPHKSTHHYRHGRRRKHCAGVCPARIIHRYSSAEWRPLLLLYTGGFY